MFAPLAEAAVRAHPCSPMESSTARTERVSREGKSSVWSHTADGVGTSASCAQALEGEGGVPTSVANGQRRGRPMQVFSQSQCRLF